MLQHSDFSKSCIHSQQLSPTSQSVLVSNLALSMNVDVDSVVQQLNSCPDPSNVLVSFVAMKFFFFFFLHRVFTWNAGQNKVLSSSIRGSRCKIRNQHVCKPTMKSFYASLFRPRHVPVGSRSRKSVGRSLPAVCWINMYSLRILCTRFCSLENIFSVVFPDSFHGDGWVAIIEIKKFEISWLKSWDVIWLEIWSCSANCSKVRNRNTPSFTTPTFVMIFDDAGMSWGNGKVSMQKKKRNQNLSQVRTCWWCICFHSFFFLELVFFLFLFVYFSNIFDLNFFSMWISFRFFHPFLYNRSGRRNSSTPFSSQSHIASPSKLFPFSSYSHFSGKHEHADDDKKVCFFTSFFEPYFSLLEFVLHHVRHLSLDLDSLSLLLPFSLRLDFIFGFSPWFNPLQLSCLHIELLMFGLTRMNYNLYFYKTELGGIKNSILLIVFTPKSMR